MTLFTTIASASASFVAIIGGFIASKLISINGERSSVVERIAELDEIIDLKFSEVTNIKIQLEEEDAIDYIREHMEDVHEQKQLEDVFGKNIPQNLEYEVLENYWNKALSMYVHFRRCVCEEKLNDDGIPVSIANETLNSSFEYDLCLLFAEYQDGLTWTIKHSLQTTAIRSHWELERDNTYAELLRELGVLKLQKEQLERQKKSLIRPKKMSLGLWIFGGISLFNIFIPLLFTLLLPVYSVEIYTFAQYFSLTCMAIGLVLTFVYLFSLLDWQPKK